MGLWLVLFLIEHLLVNSQAALWIGDNGRMFVQLVEGIHNLPYLEAIEIFLLGVPIFIHLVWGIKYLWTAKINSFSSDGSTPSLKYPRNRAYTWQRITSWILVFLLLFHIVKFRFIDYPHTAMFGDQKKFFVTVTRDDGLSSVAKRLGVQIYDPVRIGEQNHEIFREKKLKEDEVFAVTEKFGTASLLTVRDTFKNPIYIAIYTVFVLAACFHAFNGFWTFLISWGVILNMLSQKRMMKFAWGVMAFVAFLGLAAVWGTYWVNLRI